ncbi:MAG: hypothetical protein JNK64_07515 [Myxococcales bacterium]|nr:hypothetical protein [Myxococcales bacterium]
MAEAIGNDDLLRRYINPEYFNEDGTISSQAFQTTDMSVDLCRLRSLAESIAASRPGWGQSEFAAGAAFSLGLSVVHSPVDSEDGLPANPAHCHIPGKTTRTQAKRLRDAAKCVFRP